VIYAADPLLSGDVGWADFLTVVVKAVLVFVIILVAVIFMIWFERKLIAKMQNRIGPVWAGPWGLLITIADGIKLILKEDLIPERASRFVFQLAPYLALVPAILTFSIIPLGGDFSDGNDGVVTIFGQDTLLQLADPPVGILFFLAMSSLAVYGVMLAGWSSGSKYPLLGSVRATAQMVSYEAALGMAVATVVLVSGTLSTNGIVVAQDDLASWGIVATGVIPFLVFMVAGTAELNRPPFDLVEAEQELVGGFHTEYSSIRFGLFYLSEFLNTVTMSAIIVTLFLGGPRPIFDIPIIPPVPESILWFVAKLLVFLFVYVWFRATLPRFRYDQLMDLGWKVLIPLAFGWFLLITALRLADDEDWNRFLVAIVSLAVAFAAYGLLMLAFRSSARRRAREGTIF
jgi:NADH-quinone oxidoreductase subunit H